MIISITSVPLIKRLLLPVCVLSVLCSHLFADEVYTKNQKANRLYKEGNHNEALKLYDDALLLTPSDPKLKMNKGSTLFKTGDLEKAEEMYNSALATDNKKLKADAHYNMGNILYRQGEQLQMSGNPSAKEKYQAALDHYIQTLGIRPNDSDAKWNLQLAYSRIKQVEQQQQNQKDDKKDQNKDKDNKDQNKDNQQQKKDDQQKNQEQQQQQQQQDQQQQKKEEQQKQEQQNQQQMQQTEKEMKKDEAKRLLEMYADDADSLNKPPKKKSDAFRMKPEQDW